MTDGADVIDLQEAAAERPAPITPAPGAVTRPPRRACQHANTEVDPEHRRVVCKGCGEVVDAIDVLAQIADGWERHAQSRRAAESAAAMAKKRLENLQLEERRAKGRLRRMAAQEREIERRLTLLDAELRSFSPDHDTDTRRT